MKQKVCEDELLCVLGGDREIYHGLIDLGVEGVVPPVNRVIVLDDYVEVYFQFVVGERLTDWIFYKKNPEDLTKMYSDLGMLMGAVHNRGLRHVHPHMGNVIVDRQGKPVLIDWKLGKTYQASAEYEQSYPFSDSESLLFSLKFGLCLSFPELIFGLENVYWQNYLKQREKQQRYP